MKNINLFLFLLNSIVAFSQDVLMQNATVNQCSGVFYDSGGISGNYSSNQSFVLTICPENAGQLVQLNFTAFSTQINADLMTIYDGDSTAANAFGTFSGGAAGNPGFVSATQDNNPSGCLTIEFVSDGANTGSGWAATISCLTTCQTINSQLDSASPAPNGDGYIRVCPDDPITLSGSGTFSTSGTGATYEWNLGDGNTVSGQSATFSYPNPGVYIVNLNITDTNPLGCTNTNLINQVIQVGSEPDFTGTQAAQTTLCYGESTTITGIVTPVEFINDCTPPVSGTTYLPDGSGAVYSTCITVDCFESSQTLTDPNQLTNICLNMEHSYLGDLQITIISPNGQQAILKAFPGGDGTYLGGANDDDTNAPGVGADYCFSMTGTQLLVNGPTVVAGSNPPNFSIVPGTYLPVQSFSNLVGSPLNGNWCIRVVDNLAVDNGYIFSYNIEFDPNIQPPQLSFIPSIISESWDPDPSIINTSANTITVQPATVGVHCYIYRVTDDFGCEYTEEVCIDLLPNPEANADLQPIEQVECDYLGENDGLAQFDLTENSAEVLDGQDPANYTVTYYATQADAELGTDPIPNIYENISNPQTIYLRVDNDTPDAAGMDSSTCYAVAGLTLRVDLRPIFDLEDSYTLCVDTNGTEVINPPVLDTGLDATEYAFEWALVIAPLAGETAPALSAVQGGTYMVTVTNMATGCAESDSAEVFTSSPPLITVEVVTQAFSENSVIVAVATGEGAYEYSLDNGAWQENGTFTDVSYGEHTVTARDINGCGTASGSVTVLDYPHYFTPNGDGHHETWNIVGFDGQPNAKIYIFDRFGKLLKQVSPSGQGWNGTYNGELMPSNDYWFSVEYNEPSTGMQKQFRSHFTLKR